MSFVTSVRARCAATLLLLALAGCQQIAGIEKRSYHGDGGAAPGDGAVELQYPSEEKCTQYCDLLSTGCTAETSGVFAYKKDTDYCRGICQHLPSRPELVERGHSFECRLDQAKRADAVKGDPGEGSQNCKQAGAGGDGKCGSNCEAYCQLFSEICGDKSPPRPDCLNECSKLRDDDSLDADKAFSNNVDTVQCRLTHLGAATTDADVHCEHAALYVDKYTPCITASPRCEDYCGLVMSVCTEGDRQYESVEECLAVCEKGLTKSVAIPATESQDKTRDTTACRRYHAYNALLIDKVHCNHAGPGGDGHCGRVCPAYCKLAKAACGEPYGKQFANDAACEKACADLTGKPNQDDQIDLGYNVDKGKAGGATIQCRLYHASKAFTKSSECASALGQPGSECAAP